MATIKGGCFLINRKTRRIALIYRKKFRDYSFPKGHIEEGETVKECAIRETIEETGREVRLLREEPIFINKYVTILEEPVEVHMYLAEDVGEYNGVIAEEDREICKWVNINDVYELLSYEDLKHMWNDVKDKISGYVNK